MKLDDHDNMEEFDLLMASDTAQRDTRPGDIGCNGEFGFAAAEPMEAARQTGQPSTSNVLAATALAFWMATRAPTAGVPA